jgi:DNA polymerase III subunit beta
MKVAVPTADLAEALRKVLSVVTSRSTLPVLGNVLLSARSGELALSTTDLEVSITTAMAAEVSREGDATLMGRKLGQLVGTLSGDTVTIEIDENMASSISCGSARFRLLGLNAAEFPKEAPFTAQRELSFPGGEFTKVLRKIAYAVSADQTRYVLNGILLSVKEGVFTAVATDGRRLALVEKNLEEGYSGATGDAILPIKVVKELQRLLTGDEDVIIKVSDTRASFSVGKTVLTSKLVEGTYPNYRQVIPSAFSNSVSMPREQLIRVLDRVSVVVSDSGAAVKCALGENAMTLSASSVEIGEASEPLEVAYQGSPVTISFNPQFLRDPLTNLEADDITMKFNDEFKPVVVLGDEGFLCVIMPMRS